MTDEKALTTIEKPDAPAEWGSRGEIGAMADRLRVMLPNGNELSEADRFAIAQYCWFTDINPLRGEAYFYKDWRGQLVKVDGYKVLVRWAKKECPYIDQYQTLEPTGDQVCVMRCWVLRDDRKEQIEYWKGLGATWREAFEMVAVQADGVVTTDDTINKKGEPRKPPTGWTWEQVARKRALKNALNLSHGAPSPKELATASWQVNGTQTIEADWQAIPEQVAADGQAEAYAAQAARTRETMSAFAQLSPEEKQAKLEQNRAMLQGDHDPDDPFGLDAPMVPPDWAQPTLDENQEEPEDYEDYEPPPDCLLYVIPSGKHEGKTIGEALEADLRYVENTLAHARGETGEAAKAALTWHDENQVPF